MPNSIQTIQVNTTPSYEVHIGSGLLQHCGTLLRELMPACHMAALASATLGFSSVKDAVCWMPFSSVCLTRTRQEPDGSCFAFAILNFLPFQI